MLRPRQILRLAAQQDNSPNYEQQNTIFSMANVGAGVRGAKKPLD